MTLPAATPIAHHLGYAVRDADAAARRYERMLGAAFRLMPPFAVSDLYGNPAKLKVYYGAMAGTVIELIEVVEGRTPHSDFIRDHGEGIQHLGVYVPDVATAARKAIAEGGRIEWIYPAASAVQLTAGSSVEELLAAIAPHSLVYVDAKEGGTVLELLGPPIHQAVYGGALKGLEELFGAKPPPAT